jgi:hypothetical protein
VTARPHHPSKVSYRALRWLFIPVVAVHNFEEWLTFPIFGYLGPDMAARFKLQIAQPPWGAVQLALILATFAPAVIVSWASVGRTSRAKDFAVLWLAGMFLANVFAPHIPSAILAGGYTSGLVSAVVISLPFYLLLFRAAIRERVLPAKAAILAGLLGAVSLPFAVIAALALARGLVSTP